MAALLLIIVMAVAELYVIVQVAHHIGVLATILLLVLISASGPWLVRRTGLGVWRRARARLNQGDMPGREIVDGVLLLAAGVLLTVPGFLSGIAGLLLLLPPVRAVVRWIGSRWVARKVMVQVWDGQSHRGPDDVITTGSRPVEHSTARPRRRSLERPGGGSDGRATGPGDPQPPSGAAPGRDGPPPS